MRFPMIAALLCSAVLATPATAQQFTVAVVPDTQNYLDYKNQKAAGFPYDAVDLFMEQMRYIADPAHGIAFSTSVGDIWQHQSSDRIDAAHQARGLTSVPNPILGAFKPPTPMTRSFEMPAARAGYALLDGKVPFSVVAGNTDYDAQWTDSKHPPAATFHPENYAMNGVVHVAGLTNFDAVFGQDSAFFKDKPWYVAANDGGGDSAQVIEAGGWRFLHLALQFNVPNTTIAWARQVLRAHPGLPTIVSTHDCLSNDGQRAPINGIDKEAVDPAMDNNSQSVWTKLIAGNDQIFMVLCGHQPGQAFRDDRNQAGHHVYQIMADYQSRGHALIEAGVTGYNLEGGGGDGWLRLMAFDMAPAVPSVHVRTYSTHYHAYSTEFPSYAAWYKAQEKPKMSDADYLKQDDFRIDFTDFRARFAR